MTTNERLNASRYGYAPADDKARMRHGHGHPHGGPPPGMATNLLGAAGQGMTNLKSPFDRGVVRNMKDLLGLGGYAGKEAVDWTTVLQLKQEGACQRV